jgi:hypothetical protein
VTCRELISRKRNGQLRSETEIQELAREANASTDFTQYRILHEDGRQLISGWLRRAWHERDCEPIDSFEPYIFAFITLNAWASCVTGHDDDRKWRDALMLNGKLHESFSHLRADPSSNVFALAYEFQRLWPVFEVQRLRRLDKELQYKGNNIMRKRGREAVIDYFLGHPGAESLRFEPQCWNRHRNSGEVVPLDWPHTLAALYRVRCNLFHGEKARHSEIDQRIVASGFRTLIHFLANTEYLCEKLRQ